MNDQKDSGKAVVAQEDGQLRRDLLSYGALFSTAAIAATAFVGGYATPAASAQEQAGNAESLYSRLGGIFAIAAVVDYFSDRIIEDPIAGARSATAPARMAHPAAWPFARLEIHAHAVGRIDQWRAIPIYTRARRLNQSGARERTP